MSTNSKILHEFYGFIIIFHFEMTIFVNFQLYFLYSHLAKSFNVLNFESKNYIQYAYAYIYVDRRIVKDKAVFGFLRKSKVTSELLIKREKEARYF